MLFFIAIFTANKKKEIKASKIQSAVFELMYIQ